MSLLSRWSARRPGVATTMCGRLPSSNACFIMSSSHNKNRADEWGGARRCPYCLKLLTYSTHDHHMADPQGLAESVDLISNLKGKLPVVQKMERIEV